MRRAAKIRMAKTGAGKTERLGNVAVALRPYLRELASTARRLYDRGLVSGTGGNLSVRVIVEGCGLILIKKSGGCLGDATESDFMAVDFGGKPLDPGNPLDGQPVNPGDSTGEIEHGQDAVIRPTPASGFSQGEVLKGWRPSEELPMHLRIYSVRPDISAVVHAHPPYSVACGFACEELTLHTVHSSMKLGRVPVVPVVPPGSQRLADLVAKAFGSEAVKAVLLRGHGIVTASETLREAYYLADLVEETAKVAYLLDSKKPCEP